MLAVITAAARAADGFTDYGVAAKVAESRGVVVTRTAGGRCLAICNTLDRGTIGFVLVTDIDSGETRQVYCPEAVPNSPAYGSLMHRNGRFYTTQGPVFLEFDPEKCEWTFYKTGSPIGSCYIGFTEAPDGTVWAGSVGQTGLISFNPQTRELIDFGRMDDKESYLNYLAVDDKGWVYCGIGTARCNLVAFDPVTRERRSLVPESKRATGSGVVTPTSDGKVHGQAAGLSFVLYDGRATPVTGQIKVAPPRAVNNIGWGQKTGTLPDGRELIDYDLPGRALRVRDPKTGQTRQIAFDYQTEGAGLTSLAVGPAGLVYASSCHPMHLAVLDTVKGALTDLGPIPKVGGGNFCAMATQRGLLIGAQYSHGSLWAYDPAQAWNPTGRRESFGVGGRDQAKQGGSREGDLTHRGNPWELATWPEDICRPRAALAHPDGRHVMMAGFAGYGLCGGGIGLFDLQTGAPALLKAEPDLLPGHSCITLKALPNGDLVGGTSVDAPGGGHTTAKDAELFILDWNTKKLTFHTVPVPGDGNLISIEVSPEGLVYALASKGGLVVFDPATKQVVRRATLAAYGTVPRHALHWGPDSRLYVLLARAILRIAPGTLAAEKLAEPPAPITEGGALVNGVLAYAANSHVWTYKVPGP